MTSMRRWHEEVSHRWHAQAECRSDDPNVWKLFEPTGDREPAQWAWSRAETAIDEFCMNCPVMQVCAEERDRHEYLGVWGGEFSEKRGIIATDTGLLVRKFPSQIAKESSGKNGDAEPVEVEELETVPSDCGDQYAIALPS